MSVCYVKITRNHDEELLNLLMQTCIKYVVSFGQKNNVYKLIKDETTRQSISNSSSLWGKLSITLLI